MKYLAWLILLGVTMGGCVYAEDGVSISDGVPSSALIVNREDLQALIDEAEKNGAQLAVRVHTSYCEERMRQAMKDVDYYIGWSDRMTRLRVDNCALNDSVCWSEYLLKEKNRERGVRQQWEATMRECVEGKL